MKHRILTISREFGSGGRTIGKAVAGQLGIPCYDRELIEKIALQSGFAPSYVQAAEESAPAGLLGAFSSNRAFGPTNEDRLWQAQRQADRENTNAMQDAGVMQITSDPETYLRYLNCQADNPSYSAGNVALVMVQDQDATIFGTKDRWKSLMRSVSPTEEKNGVKIYTRSSFGKGYVLTDVYDVRQTSGRDLKHTALQPDSKEMTEALKTLLNYCVVPLVSDESIPMPALYDPNQMKMAVNPKYNDAEAFAGIATEIAHVRFHAKGYNQNYSRDDYELDAQSVGYMICHRFGVPCEAPDVSNLAAFYDGFEPQDRRQALGQIQDMAQKIGGSIERAITPQVRSRNVNRNAR